MFIIKNKKLFVCISGFLIAMALVSVGVFGLHLGIDFKGGTLMEVNYLGERPDPTVVKDSLKTLNLGEISVQPTGDKGFIVKSKDLKDNEHTMILNALTLGNKFNLEEKNFNSIGPSVGNELRRKAIISIILVILAISAFIAFAFRKVSKPVSSWRYGIIAIIALVHDVIIPTGIFALLSRIYGYEVDTLFVVALLTILALSISDTIVVFDRIRENLKNKSFALFSDTVGTSLSQTFTRSLNTSLTVIIALVCLFIFGPESTRSFSLVMIFGMFFGTYSSLFLASPLLVFSERWQAKMDLKKKGKR